MNRRHVAIFLALILYPSIFGQIPELAKPVQSEKEMSSTADSPVPPNPQMTAEDVGAFLDGIVPLQLERDNIAGAAVAVVKDGKVLFIKGYGYADREKKLPVSPERTLFRPGSISKLFTWTAVMQLFEQGKLDLDKDVNEYLDFKIPDAFGQPITLKHMLTHTPGFEEQIKDLFALEGGSPDLGEHLKTHIPARIYPPGTTPAYSNYATALAGYIVERVSGQPFNDYVAQNIFQALGMNHSTFAQPLPPELAPDMSAGYRLASDPAIPFEIVTVFPAGSLSSTADDMTRFMLAHLQQGEFGGGRILKPETVRLMHSRLFALDDDANAMAYGFYEESSNGQRIVGHGGDTVAFHSDLHLLPEDGVGFFVSYNSAGNGASSPRTILWRAFLDRYFPVDSENSPSPETAKQDAWAVSGSYMISRRAETSFFKLAAILGETAVAANEDGTISVAALTEANGLPKRWRAVGATIFRDVNGHQSLIFKPDADGTMQLVLPYPFMVFKRVGVWENAGILLPVLIVSLVVMLLTLVLTPVAWLVRRRFGQKLELTSMEKWLRRGIWAAFAANLLFVVSLSAMLAYSLQHLDFLSDKGKVWFYLAQIVGILGALGSLLVIYNALHAWMSGRHRIWGKLAATLLAVACLGYLWFAFAGNLLVPRGNF